MCLLIGRCRSPREKVFQVLFPEVSASKVEIEPFFKFHAEVNSIKQSLSTKNPFEGSEK